MIHSHTLCYSYMHLMLSLSLPACLSLQVAMNFGCSVLIGTVCFKSKHSYQLSCLGVIIHIHQGCCVFYVLYVFVVSTPSFGLHLFLSFLPSFFFFACSVLYTYCMIVHGQHFRHVYAVYIFLFVCVEMVLTFTGRKSKFPDFFLRKCADSCEGMSRKVHVRMS